MDEDQASPLSDPEKKLRDRFVKEYLKDYDAVSAAQRVGYSAAFAVEWATRFMAEPYTKQRISAAEETIGKGTDQDKHRHRVMTMLYREAQYRGPGASHGGRVAALAKIAAITGIEAPAKVEVTEKKSAVQFYIPSNGRDDSANV